MQPEKAPRYWLAWAMLGAVACLVVMLGVLGLFLPQTPSDVVHTKQLVAAIGSADAVKIAEKQVVADAAQNGVTVTGFKVVFNHADKDGSVVVRLRVTTIEIGSLTLDVQLSKSVYTVQAIKRTG